MLWRHPGLLVLYGRKTAFWAGLAIAAFVGPIVYYTIYAKTPTDNGVIDNLIAIPLQALVALFLFAFVIYVRLKALTDVQRIAGPLDENNKKRYDEHCLVLDFRGLPGAGKASLDTAQVGEIRPLSGLIEACIRYLPVDADDLFRFEAGGLDIPKSSLRSISLDDAGNLIFYIGSCSFRSVFFSHYFADFPLARESAEEENPTVPTLRGLLAAPVRQWNRAQLENWKSISTFECFPHLPNPLGITGVCRVYVAASGSQPAFHRWILRRRSNEVIGDINTLDWSFSGLVECFHFLAQPAGANMGMNAYFEAELQDEVLGALPLGKLTSASRLLALLLNEKYLFQPELVMYVELHMNIQQYTEVSGGQRLLFWSDSQLLDASANRDKFHAKAMFWQIADLAKAQAVT